MEVSRHVQDITRRGPIKAGIKSGLQVRGRPNQPLAGVGNILSTNQNILLGKKDKQIIKSKVAEKIQKVEKPIVNVPDAIIEAFSEHALPSNVKDIDAEDITNPQLVSKFVKDIYRYMRILENKYPICMHFMEGQPEVTGKMRAVLVDWLIQVHMKFHLLPETLYLTVAIIDRFLQTEKVRRSKLQLLGVTAMFIASKYEEMYAPEVDNFVYITDNTYDKSEILSMEHVVLKKLDFSLGKPLPLHFLRRNSKAGEVDASIHTLAKYLMELVLLEYDMAHLPPSIIAAASLYLSLKLLEDAHWTDVLAYYSGYTEKDIIPVVTHLCKLLRKAENPKLKAIQIKYSSNKFMRIATIPELSSPYVKVMSEQG